MRDIFKEKAHIKVKFLLKYFPLKISISFIFLKAVQNVIESNRKMYISIKAISKISKSIFICSSLRIFILFIIVLNFIETKINSLFFHSILFSNLISSIKWRNIFYNKSRHGKREIWRGKKLRLEFKKKLLNFELTTKSSLSST